MTQFRKKNKGHLNSKHGGNYVVDIVHICYIHLYTLYLSLLIFLYYINTRLAHSYWCYNSFTFSKLQQLFDLVFWCFLYFYIFDRNMVWFCGCLYIIWVFKYVLLKKTRLNETSYGGNFPVGFTQKEKWQKGPPPAPRFARRKGVPRTPPTAREPKFESSISGFLMCLLIQHSWM